MSQQPREDARNVTAINLEPSTLIPSTSLRLQEQQRGSAGANERSSAQQHAAGAGAWRGPGRLIGGPRQQEDQASKTRSSLLTAAALQDHIARTMRLGGPKAKPSTQPGANMTLAQHLGLIPRPPPLLTKEEWNEVHLTARLRQHSTSECAICQEDFKQDPQVLLSCSHVFHRSCLSSFERYSGTRCCPLCRAQQYQKRVIADGVEAYRHTCATRIQALVRGWLARRRAAELRRHHPPSDPRLKRTWAADRLAENSNKLVADMDAARGDLDALFAELDAGLALSRAVCGQLDQPTAHQLKEQLQIEEAVARSLRTHELEQQMEEADASSSGASQERRPREASSLVSQGKPDDSVDWEVVVARAKARGSLECPICIRRLNRKGDAGVAWLSCSHCFHLDCITSFEAYELSAGGAPTCPVCRAAYTRKCFT